MNNYIEEIGISEREFERQFKHASERGAENLEQLPKAAAAHYDKKS